MSAAPPRRDLLAARHAGVLLHPTSLPGHPGGGDLGHEAYRFVEFLAAAGFGVWQTLPLGPTHADGSPYACLSVHAGDPALVSLDWLADHGLLDDGERGLPKAAALAAAGARFRAGAAAGLAPAFADFRAREAAWLDDFALFLALHRHHGGRPWFRWPAPLRRREPAALAAFAAEHADAVEQVRFEQFVFFTQWGELRAYARDHGIGLFGDLPLFVAHDSAEVWAHPEYFRLDARGQPTVVAGVPPDYFSATGQRWGNPLYDWERMAADGFHWWHGRLATQLELFDLVRLDHFRGLEACWEIDAAEKTAVNGRWVKTPGRELLRSLAAAFDPLPLVAEDLGIITPEVEALRDEFALPGMRVLQFAFDGDAANPYLPHNHVHRSVVYTGTHDNDTTLGWYAALGDARRERVLDYLGRPGEDMPWPLIRAALASVAVLAVVPMQDLLELGSEARMNTPGTTRGNWRWRFTWDQVAPELAPRLARLNALYGRAPAGGAEGA